MSGKQSGIVWELALRDSPEVSKKAKRDVLLAMADHADHEGNNVFPGIGLLAWKTDLTPRQIMRVIKTLLADHLIELVDKRHNQYRTHHYRLTFQDAPRKSAYKAAGDTVSPAEAEPVGDIETPAGDTRKAAGDTRSSAGDIQMSSYPSIKPSIKIKRNNHHHVDDQVPLFGAKMIPKKVDPQILNLMVEVLASVCGMELEMSRSRLRVEAKSFLESGYLPDFVESKYKHGGDFWKRCWEAKELLVSGRKPTLGTIRNTLKFLKDGEKMVEVLEA